MRIAQWRLSRRLGSGLLALVANTHNAEARLTKIHAEPPVLVEAPVFGATGCYLKISGTYEGESDPADRRNAVIADIGLASVSKGKVRYSSTFVILRPRDLANGNG